MEGQQSKSGSAPQATDLPPVFHSISDIYPLQGPELDALQHRYDQLLNEFKKLHGVSPAFYARAPGRVNLIGEHIDYSGYGVLPMALDRNDTIVAVHVAENSSVAGKQQEDEIHLANLQHERFPERHITASMSIDTDHDWWRYVFAAYKGLVNVKELLGAETIGPDASFPASAAPRSIRLLVSGTVPIGSGLSSSSALVCGAMLGLMRANGQRLSKSQLADLASKAERYIGMESGGMDQAIAFLAEKGKAKKIDFDPLRSADVHLPPHVSFVVASSMVESNKYATLGSGYNMRVVECRLGAVLLAKKLGIATWRTAVRKLIHVQQLHPNSNASLEELLENVKKHLLKSSGDENEAYSLNEISNELGIEVDQVRADYLGRIVVDDPQAKIFHLFKRAFHVYAESKRVQDFADVCKNIMAASSSEAHHEALQALGRLMNESHFSCRDYFGCSCPELDDLTDRKSVV